MKICPKADDIWFYAMALINGTPAIWVKNDRPQGYYYALPMTDDALFFQNTISGENGICGNDSQFNAVIEKYNLLQYWEM